MPTAENLDLVRKQTRLIDVRAPIEFKQGHMPNSINLPILTDEERHRIGIVYKQQGNEAAVRVGHKLVSGSVRAERIAGWLEACKDHPQAQVMCWRGGQRSTLAQTWLEEAGASQKKVAGGFKALRQVCIDVLDNPNKNWWLLSGRTGSAKTVIISKLTNSIDLEGRANHRGSAFGRRLTPQPTPVTFENSLAADYLNHKYTDLVVEDESRTIGSVGLPQVWSEHMQSARIALVEIGLAERIAHIEKEYVTDALEEAESMEVTPTQIQQNYLDALQRIKRRLGGLRLSEMEKRLNQAFAGQGSHASWISYLLTEYYDPMYDFQLSKKADRIAFRGDRGEVLEFLQTKQTEEHSAA
ncbi:tRNA 2-selenouridine(34) synthase MnmH [Pseudomonadales bacterium]|nr:tRNA 2-selenouridine(34) synthase MnmH [Pseudomonadales bacterium]